MSENSAGSRGRSPATFRVTFVPGVTLGKWSRIWEQRVRGVELELTPVTDSDQLAALHDGLADMSFVRLPVDRERLSMIPLYRETPVVVVPADHVITAFEEVSVADLADEHLLQDMTPKEAIDVVATGAGVVIVPKSVARLYNRRDVTHRPVTGVAESQIGLAWLAEATDSRIEQFIGIVRGRTERSSRTDS